MLQSLADDVELASGFKLVRECREMEEVFGTHYANTVMRAGEGEGPHPRKMKEAITAW